jgi:hypothetical protein
MTRTTSIFGTSVPTISLVAFIYGPSVVPFHWFSVILHLGMSYAHYSIRQKAQLTVSRTRIPYIKGIRKKIGARSFGTGTLHVHDVDMKGSNFKILICPKGDSC